MNQDTTPYRTLEEIVGPEAAAKIRAAVGGETIYIPKNNSRNTARTLLQKGYTIDRIARSLGISLSQAYRLVKRKQPASKTNTPYSKHPTNTP